MSGSQALVFALVVAVATLLVFGLVLRPLWRAKPRSAVVLIVGLTLASAALYRMVGTPLALDPSMVRRPETLEQAIAQLERTRDRFPDHEGWVMLASAYASAGRFAESRDTWAHVVELVPDDPNFLAAAAESRARADDGHRFDAQAVAMLERALKANPQHERARLFMGVALRQQGKAKEAADTWTPLLAQTSGEANAALRAEIDGARKDAGLPPLPAEAAAPAGAGTGANALHVTVALDPAFAARVRLRPDTTVFVIARMPDGPPMPVAVEKHTLSELPLDITLDDADGPMPMAKLSAMKQVEVIARISESGNPMRQDGDIESAPVRIALPAKTTVDLTLGKE